MHCKYLDFTFLLTYLHLFAIFDVNADQFFLFFFFFISIEAFHAVFLLSWKYNVLDKLPCKSFELFATDSIASGPQLNRVEYIP